MKLTKLQKKRIMVLCREYAPEGEQSVFVNLGNEIIDFLEEKQEIWKLQRPIMTNGSYKEVLAYTEDRSHNAHISASAKEIKQLFGDELKIYVYGHSNGQNLVIDGYAPEQDW